MRNRWVPIHFILFHLWFVKSNDAISTSILLPGVKYSTEMTLHLSTNPAHYCKFPRQTKESRIVVPCFHALEYQHVELLLWQQFGTLTSFDHSLRCLLRVMDWSCVDDWNGLCSIGDGLLCWWWRWDVIPMEPSVEYGAHRRIKMMMRSSLEWLDSVKKGKNGYTEEGCL